VNFVFFFCIKDQTIFYVSPFTTLREENLVGI